VKIKDGPDPENIALILKTQCILFKRYSDILQPYKYAGYPMLIKTILMETRDEQLFSKKDQLLTNSTELAYQTIKCSSLNAEELRRESGLEYLNEAFTRCVNMLSQFSKDETHMAVQVCTHVALCFAAAAQFELCREKMLTLPNMIKDLCRCLYFKNLSGLCLRTAEAVSAFAPDQALQNALHQSGVLNHLLFYMFNYDFTLEEGGVERAKESNQQEVANHLARICVRACARLSGYIDDKEPSGGTDEKSRIL
jgi:DnaJ family protein C protein 13